jgi:hypothetical protein
MPSQVAERTKRFASFIPFISVVSNSLDIRTTSGRYTLFVTL